LIWKIKNQTFCQSAVIYYQPYGRRIYSSDYILKKYELTFG